MKINWLSIVGIAVFALIISQLKIGEIISIISKTSPAFIAIALALSLTMAFLKTLKWKLIVETQEVKFSMKEALKGFLAGFSLSLASPGRIGDFARAYFVKKTSIVKAFTTVLIDRIIDVLSIFILAIIGLFYIANFFKNEMLLYCIAGLSIAIVIGLVFALDRKRTTFILKPLFNALIPKKHKEKFKNVFNEFYESISKFMKKKKKAALSVLIGFLSWIATFAFALAIAQGVGINAGWLYIAAIIPIMLIMEMLPISIAGIGTREAAAIFFFSLIGISSEQSIAFSIMFLFLGYLVLGLFGALILAKEPIKFN